MQLFCNDGFCDICTSDDDCDTGYYCKYSKKEKIDVCSYEPLLHKWSLRTIIGMAVLFVSGAFVSGAGIGGGALFVPIMMIVNGYPADYCVSSSNPLIFGGSLAVCLFNFRLKHPDYNRPLINYNIAAIIEPLSWLGTIVGVIMNGVFPDWLLYLIQFILFSYTTYSTFKKGWADWKKIKAEREKEALELDDLQTPINDKKGEKLPEPSSSSKIPETPEFKDEAVKPTEEEKSNTTSSVAAISTSENQEQATPQEESKEPKEQKGKNRKTPLKKKATTQETQDMHENLIDRPDTEAEKPKKAYNPWVLVILAVIWAIFCVLPFFRGSGQTNSIIGIKFCSPAYWIITFAPFPVYILISYFMIRIARHYPVIGPNANLDAKQIALLIAFGITAGIASGFLGIGGGIIKGPMLLVLGIEAEEMAATSTFLILLTSCITSIQFMANGTMQYSEFGIYTAFGFVSFLIGINLIKIIINKTKNRSLILWILAATIGVATLLIAYIGIVDVVNSFKLHKKMGFREYCVA